jgi:hypothetical protein
VLLYKQPLDGEVDEAAHWDVLTCSQSSGTSRPARMCSAALAASSSPMPKPAVGFHLGLGIGAEGGRNVAIDDFLAEPDPTSSTGPSVC